MNLDFFIFLIYMSFVSFSIAFIAYAFVARMFGTTSTTSRYSQMIFIPLSIVVYDLITITTPKEYFYWVGSVPMIIIGMFLIYYRFIKGESFGSEPIVQQPKKVSVKSLRHQAKKNKRKEQNRQDFSHKERNSKIEGK